MFAARRLPLARPLALPTARLFHASTRAYVQAGDKIPEVALMEGSPGNKVNIADELKTGKGLIIGTPKAINKQVSTRHHLTRRRLQVCRPLFRRRALRATSRATSIRPSSSPRVESSSLAVGAISSAKETNLGRMSADSSTFSQRRIRVSLHFDFGLTHQALE